MKNESIKEYIVKGFDKTNIKLIEEISKFIFIKYKNIQIEILNENKGYYENVDKKRYLKELIDLSKGYTGLDEIKIKENEKDMVTIIFHEDWFFLNIDNNDKQLLERKFKIKLDLNLLPKNE
jgi:hypothetical protein